MPHKTATGTTGRVQLQRFGQAYVPHGNVLEYNPLTGTLKVAFDFQVAGDQPFNFTPIPESLGAFLDQFGNIWNLIR